MVKCYECNAYNEYKAWQRGEDGQKLAKKVLRNFWMAPYENKPVQ